MVRVDTARMFLQEKSMIASLRPRWHWIFPLAIAMVGSLLSVKATTDLNPAAIKITLPDKIPWKADARGAATIVLSGDMSKPGPYIALLRWSAHHMSHPHWHPNDRYLTVISGTWWVGTGTKFDPESTVPLPPGTTVVHYGKQIHFDGAKDGDVILEVAGEGPATSTDAEEK
jgi:hypothetical protein